MGVEIRVEGLTKRFGSQTIWEDVTFTMPAGEISVMLGPSGTGKSVFLKTLVGLLKPNAGHIWINGKDVPNLPERELYEVRKLFGVLFQDGALFGSMNLYDNIAFPLREHTKKNEGEIKRIVLEKMEMVGLIGSEGKLPGEISGGMRKRAGLARALVLDPEIILFDEPDSGLDPVRTAYLNQLIVDLNAQIEATFLIVTHDINTARTVPDNIGLLYRRHLAMFGPREMLLSSNEPVVLQFLNARRQGPIGMAEEKDSAELAAEAEAGGEGPVLPPIPLQLLPTGGMVRRTMRPPGMWLRENGVTPPEGSEVMEADVQARAAEAMGVPAEDVRYPVPRGREVGWSGDEDGPGPTIQEGYDYSADGDGEPRGDYDGYDDSDEDLDEYGYAYDEYGYAYDAEGYVYDDSGNIYTRDGWIPVPVVDGDDYDAERYDGDGHERYDGYDGGSRQLNGASNGARPRGVPEQLSGDGRRPGSGAVDGSRRGRQSASPDSGRERVPLRGQRSARAGR